MNAVTVEFKFEGTHDDIQYLLGDIFGSMNSMKSVAVLGQTLDLKQPHLLSITDTDVEISYSLSRRYGSRIDKLLGSGGVPMYTFEVTGAAENRKMIIDVVTDALLNAEGIVDESITRTVS